MPRLVFSSKPSMARSARLGAIIALGIGIAALSATPVAANRIEHGRPVHSLSVDARGTAYSTNWSGYAAYQNGASFSDAKANWIQPAATCAQTKTQYASFWVGLDGYNSSSVEQIGTDSDCRRGHGAYYAWYEMYPAPPVNLSMAIRPGDAMSAEVSVTGSTFTLTIVNTTTGATFTTQQTSTSAALTSAEWVAEAPSSCSRFACSVLPLANFGTVNFTGSYATSGGQVGAIGSSAWQNDSVVMETNSGTVKALPSSLSAGGTAFSDTWHHS